MQTKITFIKQTRGGKPPGCDTSQYLILGLILKLFAPRCFVINEDFGSTKIQDLDKMTTIRQRPQRNHTQKKVIQW
jgi:hypothetical protein